MRQIFNQNKNSGLIRVKVLKADVSIDEEVLRKKIICNFK